jgi:nitrogen fixation NifU-like protein
MENTTQLDHEIIEHLMHPKNYGPLENPTGVGVGHSEQSGEFVIFYLNEQEGILQNVGYATNGCHDTVVLGSMFTEMIKGESLAYAQSTALKLQEKVALGPVKQQACAQMVLTAFEAAKIHQTQKAHGSSEDLHAIEIGMECEVNHD